MIAAVVLQGTFMHSKDAVVNVRVEKDLKRALVAAAKADDRSMGRMAERLMREGLERRGLLKPRPQPKAQR